MTNLRRVNVLYSGPAVVGPAFSRFHFTTGLISDQDCVDAVHDAYQELGAHLGGGLTYSVGSTVEYFDIVTGEIQSLGVVTPWSLSGAGGTALLPFATQGLIRWRTGAYIGGREVRGRTFLPGWVEGESDIGVPTEGARAAMTNFSGQLIVGGSSTYVCWTKTHGTAAAITNGDPWTQWAVLRSRRD